MLHLYLQKKYTSVLMPQIKECVVKQGNKSPPVNQQTKQTKNNPKSKSNPQPPKQKQNDQKNKPDPSAVLPGSQICLMNLQFVSASRYSLNSFDRLANWLNFPSALRWGCQSHFLLRRKPNTDPCFGFFALPVTLASPGTRQHLYCKIFDLSLWNCSKAMPFTCLKKN